MAYSDIPATLTPSSAVISNKTSGVSKLSIEYVPITALKENSRNARTHSKRQTRKIAASIKEFGFTNPVLVDSGGTIIAGHGRVAAAKLLGLDVVPIIHLEGLSTEQLRTYVMADNKLAELAGWDRDTLAIELQFLLSMEEFDITITGFEVAEIDLILQEVKAQSDPQDHFETSSLAAPVSTLGDLWILGKHHLLCGDALQRKSFVELMQGKRAAVVVADSPFNVAIAGNVSGKGSIHHREFAMASGEMSKIQFIAFLQNVIQSLAEFSREGSIHYLFMDWRHMGELLAAGDGIYDELLNLCVWAKDNGGMGSLYRSRHELVFVFRNGKGKHQNNVQLGKFGRNRTNVWEYPGVSTFSKQGDEGNLLALHPTVKPVALVADAILDCSSRGDIVLDCFLGSGTTLMAAERTGRVCYGMEIDPQYVDVAIRRWQKHTGGEAVHVASGKTFNQLDAEKKGDGDVQE